MSIFLCEQNNPMFHARGNKKKSQVKILLSNGTCPARAFGYKGWCVSCAGSRLHLPFQDVFQFPDVSMPPVAAQRLALVDGQTAQEAPVCPLSLTGYSPLSYVQHMRAPNAIPDREERVPRFVSQCRTREEMPKRLIDSALFGLGCLVLLLWQLSAPVLAQAPAKNTWRQRAQ